MTDTPHCAHEGPWPHRVRAFIPPTGEGDIDLCVACYSMVSDVALEYLTADVNPGLPVFMQDGTSPEGDDPRLRVGRVELVNAPEGVNPHPEFVDRLLAVGCATCMPNLTLYWIGRVGTVEPQHHHVVDERYGGMWVPQWSHDNGCPTIARIERERKEGS